jgi:hypothetical protein
MYASDHPEILVTIWPVTATSAQAAVTSRVKRSCDGVNFGGPAMARIARDYGYTVAELRKL